jgi:hypothetical protein
MFIISILAKNLCNPLWLLKNPLLSKIVEIYRITKYLAIREDRS